MNASWMVMSNQRPLNISGHTNLLEFELTNSSIHYCIQPGYRKDEHLNCLFVRLYFTRHVGHYITATFFSNGVIMAVSWIAFWIDRDAAPARIMLGFTTLVTLSAQAEITRMNTPLVAYTKAIDVWYAMCLVFLVAGLVEFAVVNTLLRRGRHFAQLADGQHVTQWAFMHATSGRHKRYDAAARHQYGERSRLFNRRSLQFDHVSRLLFPCAFILFAFFFFLIVSLMDD